jgi:hypothetical protein
MFGMVERGVIAGRVRLDPLVRRFGFGGPLGVKGVPAKLGVPAGDSVSSFFDPPLAGWADSASASAFARWKASYRLPTCDR